MPHPPLALLSPLEASFSQYGIYHLVADQEMNGLHMAHIGESAPPEEVQAFLTSLLLFTSSSRRSLVPGVSK